MKKLAFLLFLFCSVVIYSQCLPLKIGNQWHYEIYTGLTFNKILAATDTVEINNIQYYKIDFWSVDPNFQLSGTYYDRLEGDSLYVRLLSSGDTLFIFNFNWANGQLVTFQGVDSCINLKSIIRNTSTYFGVTADGYVTHDGYYCPGMPDTAWVLTSQHYSRFFGATATYGDGALRGALINDTAYGNLYPVPVELVSFNSSVTGNDVTLTWATVTETNNSGFEIERSKKLDARSEAWESIEFIAGNGTTTKPHTYSYTDKNLPAGKYQYRLKQIDLDGTFEYSKTVEAEISSLNEFVLEQNYPNPFNPVTKIRYSIPTPPSSSPLTKRRNEIGFVTLKVYDILGNEVATLVNEYKPAGTYEVEFNPESNIRELVSGVSAKGGYASGVYFYQLIVHSNNGVDISFTKSKKMLFLK